jgi:hypothetical protein
LLALLQHPFKINEALKSKSLAGFAARLFDYQNVRTTSYGLPPAETESR